MADGGLQTEIVERRRPELPGQPVDLGAGALGQPLESRKRLLMSSPAGTKWPSSSRPSCNSVSVWPSVSCSSRAISQSLGLLILHSRAQRLRQFRLGHRATLRLMLQFLEPGVQFDRQRLLLQPRELPLPRDLVDAPQHHFQQRDAQGLRRLDVRAAPGGGMQLTDSRQAAKLLRGVRRSPSGPVSIGLFGLPPQVTVRITSGRNHST